MGWMIPDYYILESNRKWDALEAENKSLKVEVEHLRENERRLMANFRIYESRLTSIAAWMRCEEKDHEKRKGGEE